MNSAKGKWPALWRSIFGAKNEVKPEQEPHHPSWVWWDIQTSRMMDEIDEKLNEITKTQVAKGGIDIRTNEGIRNQHSLLMARGKSKLEADWTLHEQIMRGRIGLLYSELPSEESKAAFNEAWEILGLALGRAGGVK